MLSKSDGGLRRLIYLFNMTSVDIGAALLSRRLGSLPDKRVQRFFPIQFFVIGLKQSQLSGAIEFRVKFRTTAVQKIYIGSNRNFGCF